MPREITLRQFQVLLTEMAPMIYAVRVDHPAGEAVRVQAERFFVGCALALLDIADRMDDQDRNSTS